ncbi:AAA family ATPase [Aliivibrio kagoshimensis]|uniref:AAA family ATPase n=1 Tax=Aliivibrio kagoshimensis TaxID=2910230 RepID=UPI003D147073
MHQQNQILLLPQYDNFNTIFEQFDQIENNNLSKLQPRLIDAIKRFCLLKSQVKILQVNAPDNFVYRQIIKDWISDFTASPVIQIETLSERELFGCVHQSDDGGAIIQPGAIHHADGGYLILSVTTLLANPTIWFRLKTALLSGEVNWQPSDPKRSCNLPAAANIDINLVLVGDRSLLGDLDQLEPDLRTGMSLFSEFELETELTEHSLPFYIGYIKQLLNNNGLPALHDADALKQLLIASAREYEDQSRISLCPIWNRTLLAESAIDPDTQQINAQMIKGASLAKLYRENYLPERALGDIYNGQVLIETQGERVGQINALTVLEVPGHPRGYGEPARLSCVIHFGDGEISDVERKSELGGNIHAKGMMIMQAFVTNALQLHEALPYSASMVFEQSYCEVDGDSASLAELCCLISALAEKPIDQQIAITGAVDQFGQVQAIGGVNEKIEGFFNVCSHQGLTGKQGVIIPTANLSHLVLNDDVITAVNDGKFHIWPVDDASMALEKLTALPLKSEEEESLLNLINQRIHDYEHPDHCSFSWLRRVKNWFVQH